MTHIIRNIFYLVIALTSSCSFSQTLQEKDITQMHDTISEKRVPQKFFFQMSEDQRNQFITKAKSIHIGDTWETVKKLLGKPDEEKKIIPKDNPFSASKGTIRKYRIQKLSEELVNEKYDQNFYLIFSPSEVLIEIESNIEGYYRIESISKPNYLPPAHNPQ